MDLPLRARSLNNHKHPPSTGPIIYWMSRDQRVQHNWALISAYQVAQQLNRTLHVIFELRTDIAYANQRHYHFMFTGLKQVEQQLKELNIPWYLLTKQLFNQHLSQHKPALLITDFSPFPHSQKHKKTFAKSLDCPVWEIDTHNLIPAWIASNHQEYAAHTLRKKYHNTYHHWLEPFPLLKPTNWYDYQPSKPTNWHQLWQNLKLNPLSTVDQYHPGGLDSAQLRWQHFLKSKLNQYTDQRNDPNQSATTDLSPYLHFGNISAHAMALDLIDHGQQLETSSLLEELLVRRELAENYVFYNPNFDNPKGIPDWAQKTLTKHASDKRPYIYTEQQFEQAQTHEPLWNAAQLQMVQTGKMHGYLRMYWAKKILEWTPDLQTAWQITIKLNDTYNLDGRDPNGYTGIAWSLGGVHDRPWQERPIFGMIRYMNRAGCDRKFDTQSFINKYSSAPSLL